MVRLSAISACSSGVRATTTGSGSHGPTSVSRRHWAEVNRSSARRVVTVVNHAGGRSIDAMSAVDHRSQASWQTSSASARLPSSR